MATAKVTLQDGREVVLGPLDFQMEYTPNEEVTQASNTGRRNKFQEAVRGLFARDENGGRVTPYLEEWSDNSYVFIAADKIVSVSLAD